MNWRDTLIGSGITLVVTVLAGLLVYYFTRAPALSPPAENVVYSVEPSATFGIDPSTITFLTMRISNIGQKTAKNVKLVASIPQQYIIQSKQILVSSGETAPVVDNSSENHVDVLVPHLVPSELVTISLLVKGPSGLDPTVNVRSDDSIGTRAPIYPQTAPTGTKGTTPERLLLISLLVAAVVLLLQLLITAVASRRSASQEIGLNNTAFVFLHHGLTTEARQLLSKAISDYGGDPLLISNYALALGLEGDVENARKHFEIAQWWAMSRHQRAVVAYNQAVLLIHNNGPISEVTDLLRKAFAGSRKDISRYCELSTLIGAAQQRFPELRSLIEHKGR